MRRFLTALLIGLPLTAIAGSGSPPDELEQAYSKMGNASYYSSRLHGRKTASGELYDQTALTAAHPDLPFDTIVCVTNTRNGQSVSVRINDRGPYTGGRIIDLSRRAARELGMINAGSARVRVESCPQMAEES
ncbi:septal ring lytic transglycosylase RlpA family protein [Halopseudomonas nanhaiensis]|uniref:septal ring lytic transglycosylase RlpA family protein n=1 Tax=Halopseudomonas nanhaiensis TaxID=2830842 RepID=UPI001CC13FEA|nr:septal ring lytic transglycosylase RlpA family protein [Halopseudomonas nanhaiensis]UAW97896.1 septal ring lytic transglycosylase RlpA family protein [Halopseudomonas nanhaiensis]